ncbi:hypothetical protein [Halomonas sp. NO4]|uniref:hypothetical protein n=1 Tax=Halomonas sp. NO4 TaxID=2484813 RepID=UPI0013D5C0B4|nr:hypothetical protein [Halomonas sp. NO4]
MNPIRAGIAETPETSEHTSVAERVAALAPEAEHVAPEGEDEAAPPAAANVPAWCDSLPLQPLMPFDATAQLPSAIPFSLEDYLELVETAGRCQRPDKRGAIAERVPRLLKRLNIEPEAFIAASTTLLKRFGSSVGTPASLTICCAARQVRHLRGMRAAWEVFERRVA